jgi:hypothetical protein
VIARFRACWVIQLESGWLVVLAMWTRRVDSSMNVARTAKPRIQPIDLQLLPQPTEPEVTVLRLLDLQEGGVL